MMSKLTFHRDKLNRVVIVIALNYIDHQMEYPQNDTMPLVQTSQRNHSINIREKMRKKKIDLHKRLLM